MTDLHESYIKAKEAEADREHEQRKCLVCFHMTCTCKPGAGWTERDSSGV